MHPIELKLPELSEVSERTADLRVLAAKVEPLAEFLENEAFGKVKYDVGQNASAERRQQVEAEAAAWNAPAQELAAAVDELRQLADRVDQAIGAARSMIRGAGARGRAEFAEILGEQQSR